ncbi:hypothetical protein DAEQUDRAFT_728628 [Daedalea quercina L-15889]|uniref:Thioesterase/thiol ester dehydrase-isomerase n=1 Tax=Daedalea quercina L-15889 TaxID=1314783 RepID=A0A165P7B6_9APHY|nr:hypothetical protein DAEQUDRAFT_728628 [Daedalea quercina L-15889]
MFADGFLKDTIMDAVRSLARVPTPRFSAGSLGQNLLRYAIVLLLLVNARSWPFTWHFRVFRPVISLRFQWYLLQLRLLFKSKRVKQRVKAKWLGDLCPVGLDPLELVHTWKSWASPDDSDFNLHLSNSCYAKSLDCVRLEAALKCFPTLFRAGGWMALGATHYNFLREIPILSPYEVRVRIAAWDNKWVYIVARYVTHPRKKSKKNHGPKALAANGSANDDIQTSVTPPKDENTHIGGAPYPVLHTPSDPLDPDAKSDPSTPTPSTVVGSTDDRAHTVASALRRTSQVHVEPDGATLNCVIVNALCFKIGRITIPPALALAVEGFTAPGTGSEPASYSVRNPPPFWEKVQELKGEDPMDLRKLQAMYAGGWRAVPESERWWEQALAGLEERRRAGMEVVGALRQGMEGVRSL